MLRRFVGLRFAKTISIGLFALAIGGLAWAATEYESGRVWPEPKVVQPGEGTAPPADAIVLFDGKDMSAFNAADAWIVKDGIVTVARNGAFKSLGYAETKQPFGDCQLHLEFATPEKVVGKGQGRGNSGVYFMGHYELQILDSYDNPTYFDGQCGALYKQMPPQVNVCRKPGEWQTYDVVFHAPKFDESGKLLKPASITAFQNGVLVQDHFEIEGTSSYDHKAEYTAHPTKLPLQLQDHGNPVKFRNIWIRELSPKTFTMGEKKTEEKAKSGG